MPIAMSFGYAIRRNIALVLRAEKASLLIVLLQLNTGKFSPDEFSIGNMADSLENSTQDNLDSLQMDSLNTEYLTVGNFTKPDGSIYGNSLYRISHISDPLKHTPVSRKRN